MRYGINLPNGGECGDARTLAEMVALAEEAGWDGVFLEDYIVWQGHQDVPTYDPWVALAAMALQTDKIRLGTTVTPLARRRPWKVARETVTLDHLSHGRLILGVGLGDAETNDISFTHFGEATDFTRRARMLDEALDILVGLWSGQPFSYRGEYYQVNQVTLLPRPLQTPRIPIWVGGGYPREGPMRRASRWDGACLYKVGEDDMRPADVLALKAFVEGIRSEQVPFDIVVGGGRRRPDWEGECNLIKSLAEAGATWWLEYVPPVAPEVMREAIKRGPLRIN